MIRPRALGGLEAWFPVAAGTKRPLVDWEVYQSRRPTPDEQAEWERRFPGCNRAVPTGRITNRIVLDVDPRHGGVKSLEGRRMPLTFLIRTPHEGLHYHLGHPGSTVRNRAGVLPGVDVRGDGGLVLVPPSVVDGKPYEILVDEPLAPAPEWLLQLLRPARNGQGRLGESEVVSLLRGVGEGQRNDTAARLAGHFLAKRLPPGETLEMLRAWNARNHPPLPDAELVEVVRSVAEIDHRNHPERSPSAGAPTAPLEFPADAYVGLADDFAQVYSEHTESPRPFLFMAFLAYLGSLVSHRVRLRSEVTISPRLYLVGLGRSGFGRKSATLDHTDRFFREAIQGFGDYVHYGLGSAEGLARRLGRDPRTNEIRPLMVHLDEARSLTDKARPEGSILLPMLATLFERTVFDNTTKTHTISVRDGHLSLVAASTVETYAAMWTSSFLDIGFTNRLWLVVGDTARRIALPAPIPEERKRPLTATLGDLLARIDHAAGAGELVMTLDPEAARAWDGWYEAMPRTIYARRLDTYGWRLMILLSLSRGDFDRVSADTVGRVCRLLDHQLALRQQYDPIDAETTVARMEEMIRRALRAHGPLTRRDLRRYTNADRAGLWVFETATDNLRRAGDVEYNRATKRYAGVPEAVHDA